MKTDIMAYYFPNWHPTELNDKWHGKGWTEWEVLKCARPRFEGHRQPKIPLWGYEDESDVKVMEKKIVYAKENAIDGFIWDWYWFNEGPYRIDCLDNAFLKATNSTDLKFAVMWCNHDPICAHPAGYNGVKEKTLSLLDGHFTEQTFIKGTQHCIDNYFNKENYYRLDGGLYFSFNRPDMLIESFGGVEGCRAMLDDFRDRTRRAGFGELNINANIRCLPQYRIDRAKALEDAKAAGFDSVGYYNIIRDGTDAFPFQAYDKVAQHGMDIYADDVNYARDAGIGYYTAAVMGWDTSPRTVQSDRYENIGYPFSHIINDNTPEKFEKNLILNKEFCLKNDIPMLAINAWNEWTEGSYLEPDTEYQDGYAKAIKTVFGNKE